MKGLLSWYWSVNFADNIEIDHFQLETHPLYFGFSVEILLKHL